MLNIKNYSIPASKRERVTTVTPTPPFLSPLSSQGTTTQVSLPTSDHEAVPNFSSCIASRDLLARGLDGQSLNVISRLLSLPSRMLFHTGHRKRREGE
ncbi:unnamed protein product [Victoria cruziana]